MHRLCKPPPHRQVAAVVVVSTTASNDISRCTCFAGTRPSFKHVHERTSGVFFLRRPTPQRHNRFRRRCCCRCCNLCQLRKVPFQCHHPNLLLILLLFVLLLLLLLLAVCVVAAMAVMAGVLVLFGGSSSDCEGGDGSTADENDEDEESSEPSEQRIDVKLSLDEDSASVASAVAVVVALAPVGIAVKEIWSLSDPTHPLLLLLGLLLGLPDGCSLKFPNPKSATSVMTSEPRWRRRRRWP
mmetsp:Transcript_56903/g.106900  ORF Transcript_56903/g.106900 Transcript_56903/m.106900 type:complete len:241 (-) Transcript_56903:262-984(-)